MHEDNWEQRQPCSGSRKENREVEIMKRFLALLLFLAMLVSSAAAEKVFVNDAQKLLNSVNLNGYTLYINGVAVQ